MCAPLSGGWIKQALTTSRSKRGPASTSHSGWGKCSRLGETSTPLVWQGAAFDRFGFSDIQRDIRARLGTSRLVQLDMPDALSERVMNALKADPRTVDLRALAPHFYSLSERILELFEEEDMVDVLSDVRPRAGWPLRPFSSTNHRHPIARLSRHELRRLRTMRITRVVPWGRGWISSAVWTRPSDNVREWVDSSGRRYCVLT